MGDRSNETQQCDELQQRIATCPRHRHIFNRLDAMICRGAPYASDDDCPKQIWVRVGDEDE